MVEAKPKYCPVARNTREIAFGSVIRLSCMRVLHRNSQWRVKATDSPAFPPTHTSRLVFLSLALVLVVQGCTRDAVGAPREGEVAIGIAALAQNPGYENVIRGASMAVEQLNSTGNDITLRLAIPEPGATSAVQVAQQLVDDRSVVAVVGHPESGTMLEVLPIYEDAEHHGRNALVAVSPTASSPRLTGISPWFFRIAPSDNDAARYVADWVRDSLGVSRAAIVFRNDTYGRDWSATFAAQFRQRGGMVSIENPYLTRITEWEAYAEHIAAVEPQVILFPGDTPDALEFLAALKSRRVNIPFIGGDGTEGIREDPLSAGARFVSFYQPGSAPGGVAQRFLEEYRKRYNAEPDMFAALSYDAAMTIGKAIASGARNRLEVRDALARIGKGGLPPVDGAGGIVAFNEQQDIAGRPVVVAPAWSRSK